jgi:hypothetical protein
VCTSSEAKVIALPVSTMSVSPPKRLFSPQPVLAACGLEDKMAGQRSRR